MRYRSICSAVYSPGCQIPHTAPHTLSNRPMRVKFIPGLDSLDARWPVLKGNFQPKTSSCSTLAHLLPEKLIQFPALRIHRLRQHFELFITWVPSGAKGHWRTPYPFSPEIDWRVPAAIFFHGDTIPLDNNSGNPIERKVDVGHLRTGNVTIRCLNDKLLGWIEPISYCFFHRCKQQYPTTAGRVI